MKFKREDHIAPLTDPASCRSRRLAPYCWTDHRNQCTTAPNASPVFYSCQAKSGSSPVSRPTPSSPARVAPKSSLGTRRVHEDSPDPEFSFFRGSGTYIVPMGVTEIQVTMIGGGGGGGGDGSYTGGGGGQGATWTLVARVTAGLKFTVKVGAGGAMATKASCNAGVGGGSTVVSGGTSLVFTAPGGEGGGDGCGQLVLEAVGGRHLAKR